MRKTIAVDISGPLRRAENGIDLTMLTIGSLMVEMKYQTSAQARSVKGYIKPHQLYLDVLRFVSPILGQSGKRIQFYIFVNNLI